MGNTMTVEHAIATSRTEDRIVRVSGSYTDAVAALKSHGATWAWQGTDDLGRGTWDVWGEAWRLIFVEE